MCERKKQGIPEEEFFAGLLKGVSLTAEEGRVVARFVCVVCKKPILNESDGIALGHDLGGLGVMRWWITHRLGGCMGPCTAYMTLIDLADQLSALYGFETAKREASGSRSTVVSAPEQKAVIAALIKSHSVPGAGPEVTGKILKGVFDALGLVPDGDLDYHADLGGGPMVRY